jgi:hypothetical protein
MRVAWPSSVKLFSVAETLVASLDDGDLGCVEAPS